MISLAARVEIVVCFSLPFATGKSMHQCSVLTIFTKQPSQCVVGVVELTYTY